MISNSNLSLAGVYDNYNLVIMAIFTKYTNMDGFYRCKYFRNCLVIQKTRENLPIQFRSRTIFDTPTWIINSCVVSSMLQVATCISFLITCIYFPPHSAERGRFYYIVFRIRYFFKSFRKFILHC